ncbi:MAG TPA: glycosyltransferase family 39 protein [Candidatus Methylomirabilis sp.]|nr:glycosyltransferase family 39 protein [Candidatus Methylomirabilis sp.]
MNVGAEPWTGRRALAWAGVIAAACAVYLAGIGHEPICYDEVISDAIAGHRLGEILGLLRYDNHPPLFYLLLHGVRAALGSSEWTLRLLSAAGSVGLVALGAGPVRRLVGERTALLYAGVALCMPVLLIYAHEARMYTLAACAVTAAAAHGALAVRDGRHGDWWGLGVASLAAAYLHNYALMAAFFIHAFVLGWVLLRRRERLAPCLWTGGLVAAGYAPWLARVLGQAAQVKEGGFWVPPLSWRGLAEVLLRPFVYKELYPGYPPVRPWMIASLALSGALIVWGILEAWRHRDAEARTTGALLLVAYVGTLTAAIVVSLVLRPVLFHRYMIVCTGAFALLVAMGAARLPGRASGWAALAMLALLDARTFRDVYTQTLNAPMRQVTDDLRYVLLPGDLIITSDSWSLGPSMYYLPEQEHYHTDNKWESRWGQILEVLVPPLHREQGLKTLLSTRRSFWFLTCSIGLAKDISEIVDYDAGWEPQGDPRVWRKLPLGAYGFTAQRYVFTGRAQEGGTLEVHLTGIRPGGNLFVNLFDRPPLQGKPARWKLLPADGPELTFRLGGLPDDDYALIVLHDENGNGRWDLDPQGRPLEGGFAVNGDKVIADAVAAGMKAENLGLTLFTFENLKFPFAGPKQVIEAKMTYPPPAAAR